MYKFIRHNQGTFVGLVLACLLIVYAYGCESTVQSLVKPDKVSRVELQAELTAEVKRYESEIDKLYATAQARFETLDKQDAIKSALFDALSVATQGGTFNPMGLIPAAMALAGIGIGVDNRIKDKIIKNRPLPNNNQINVT